MTATQPAKKPAQRPAAKREAVAKASGAGAKAKMAGKTLELTDAILLKMLRSPVYRENFDFIDARARAVEATRKPKAKGCGCAARSQVTVTTEDLAYLRRKIANMPTEKKLRMRQLLQVKAVVVRGMSDDGRSLAVKF